MNERHAPNLDPRLEAELREIFEAELTERVQAMDLDLLALERAEGPDARRPAVNGLLRNAHSLKGGAQIIDERAIADLCDAVESYLEGVREDPSMQVGALQLIFDAVGV